MLCPNSQLSIFDWLTPDFSSQLKYDLFRAYYDARQNKRNTFNQLRFEIEHERNLLTLYERILDHTYEIRKSIAFIVNEPVKREIFAADFSDRVIHHLIFNYINPILDTQFSEDSYSCRIGKGTHYAIERMTGYLKACSADYTQDCHVLKLDIKGYFMAINKHLLWRKLQKMINSVRYAPLNPEDSSHCWNDCFDFDLVWWLMDKVIWHDPIKSCIIKGKMSDWDGLPPTKSLFHNPPDCGLPIGNLTSQLFSNVYLHDFDCFVKKELGAEYYGRYVDDFVIIHRDKAFLLDALDKIKCYLQEQSGLVLHPNKIYLQHYSKGFAFLGVYIKPYRCYIANRTKRKFHRAVSECDKRLAKVRILETKEGISKTSKIEIEKVRATINSYLGVMRHYSTYNLRRKTLLKKHRAIFKYGFLETHLHKYSVHRKYLNKNFKRHETNNFYSVDFVWAATRCPNDC